MLKQLACLVGMHHLRKVGRFEAIATVMSETPRYEYKFPVNTDIHRCIICWKLFTGRKSA